MAHALGLNVVAEGVETAGQARILCELGCDLGQGFLWGKPGTLDAGRGAQDQEAVDETEGLPPANTPSPSAAGTAGDHA